MRDSGALASSATSFACLCDAARVGRHRDRELRDHDRARREASVGAVVARLLVVAFDLLDADALRVLRVAVHGDLRVQARVRPADRAAGRVLHAHDDDARLARAQLALGLDRHRERAPAPAEHADDGARNRAFFVIGDRRLRAVRRHDDAEVVDERGAIRARAHRELRLHDRAAVRRGGEHELLVIDRDRRRLDAAALVVRRVQHDEIDRDLLRRVGVRAQRRDDAVAGVDHRPIDGERDARAVDIHLALQRSQVLAVGADVGGQRAPAGRHGDGDGREQRDDHGA